MVKLKVGIIFTKIENLTPYQRRVVDKCTSYFVQGSQFTKLYRQRSWDGVVHLLNRKDMVPSGMVSTIERRFKKHDISYKVVDLRKKFKIKKTKIPKGFILGGRKLRPYQRKAVEKALKERIGAIVIPTGTGKTFVMCVIMHLIKDKKFAVLATGTSLLLQLKDELEEFLEERVGYIGEGCWDLERVTVSSIDTLSEMLLPPPKKIKFKNKGEKIKYTNKVQRWMERKPQAEDFLVDMDGICLDEAHRSPARSFKAVLVACVNATIRVSFTATFMRSGSDDMLLEAMTGGIIYKKSTSWMIRNGYLARPVIILLKYDEKTDYSDYKEAYGLGIVSNNGRNKLLTKAICEFYRNKLTCVVFVREKKHGDNIFGRLEHEGLRSPKMVFATGAESGSVRKRILKGFRGGKIRVLLCTRIFNEGIDFPEGNCGVKTDSLKYEGVSIQQLGRLLRKIPGGSGEIDREREEKVFFLDVMDMHNEYLTRHAIERMETYEKEEEFIVEVASNFKDVANTVAEHIGEVITVGS